MPARSRWWQQRLDPLPQPVGTSFSITQISVLRGRRHPNVSSVHADNPNPGGSDYDCSKGAVRMLTRTLALEIAPHQINVNSLAPEMVLTPFN